MHRILYIFYHAKILKNIKFFFIFRKARRCLPITELRRAARKPWRNLPNTAITKTPIPPPGNDLQVVILDWPEPQPHPYTMEALLN